MATDNGKKLTKKQLKEAQALARSYELLRQGKIECVVCGCVTDAHGGGKTRRKYCGQKCKNRARWKRINEDAQAMGADCYRVWLALNGDDKAREQYVEWIMLLGTTGWKYAHMFQYRFSQARTVIVRHFGDKAGGDNPKREGQAALDAICSGRPSRDSAFQRRAVGS